VQSATSVPGIGAGVPKIVLGAAPLPVNRQARAAGCFLQAERISVDSWLTSGLTT